MSNYVQVRWSFFILFGAFAAMGIGCAAGDEAEGEQGDTEPAASQSSALNMCSLGPVWPFDRRCLFGVIHTRKTKCKWNCWDPIGGYYGTREVDDTCFTYDPQAEGIPPKYLRIEQCTPDSPPPGSTSSGAGGGGGGGGGW